jgi:hypothetical protein
MKYDFPRISRSRLKTIDENSTEIGDGKTTDPTEEERAWLDILKSTAPELEKTKKKISVCAFADVIEYSKESITVLYDGIKYTIKKPANGFRIARAMESSVSDAFAELNEQRQIVIGAVPLPKDFSGIETEVIILLTKVAESFFFAPYL